MQEVCGCGRSNDHHRLSTYLCLVCPPRLSLRLLQSAPDPLCGPNHGNHGRRHPLPSSSRSRARIHMYLAPDTMDSEMAPLVDRPTETPPLDRKTEDDSGNGRRSERRRRGERGRRGSERAEERRGELCCRGHTLRLPEKAFLATSPLGALSTK